MNTPISSDPERIRSFFPRIIKKLLGRNSDNKESVLHLLREAKEKSIVDADALSIIEGALQVSEMQVREIMIPRTQMSCVKYNMEEKKLLNTIIESGHSRFPVVGDNPDEIIGILLAKDLISMQLNENEKLNIKDKMRQATFIPESKRVNILLKDFRDKRNHMAIVVNEYGGVSGLVTIEDVLEQIVGEIEDEHDTDDDAFIKKLNDHEYMVKAITPVEEFDEYFSTRFTDDEFETIAGLVLKTFKRLPKRGEHCKAEGLKFTVLNADNRSIKLLQVTLNEQKAAELLKKHQPPGA